CGLYSPELGRIAIVSGGRVTAIDLILTFSRPRLLEPNVRGLAKIGQRDRALRTVDRNLRTTAASVDADPDRQQVRGRFASHKQPERHKCADQHLAQRFAAHGPRPTRVNDPGPRRPLAPATRRPAA